METGDEPAVFRKKILLGPVALSRSFASGTDREPSVFRPRRKGKGRKAGAVGRDDGKGGNYGRRDDGKGGNYGRGDNEGCVHDESEVRVSLVSLSTTERDAPTLSTTERDAASQKPLKHK